MITKPIVSILVHTKNSERTIQKLLESIKNQSYKPIEIIVVDNNSIDKTLEISKKYTKKMYTFGPERSAQRNYAAAKALGVFYLVPDSDMILGKDVISKCVDLVTKNPKVKAVVIPEKSTGKGFWARCKALERSFYVGISWMEGARFFSKVVFWEMGGYDEKITGTEDYDLPQRIREKYGDESIGRIEEFIYHDEGNLSFFGTLKKKFYYAKKLHVYKKNNPHYFKKQANVLLRMNIFLTNPKKLLESPLVSLGLFAMKIGEIIAWGFGYLFFSSS